MVFGGKLGWFRGGGGLVAVFVFGVRCRGPGHDEVAQGGRGSEELLKETDGRRCLWGLLFLKVKASRAALLEPYSGIDEPPGKATYRPNLASRKCTDVATRSSRVGAMQSDAINGLHMLAMSRRPIGWLGSTGVWRVTAPM